MVSLVIEEKTKETDFRYFDMNGAEIHAGDFIRNVDTGEIQEVYLGEHRQLGTDATNPAWIKSDRAYRGEYGLYPLHHADLIRCVKCY